MSKNSNCLVVGSGYAVLTVTRQLLKAGKTVKLLKARERVGGRIYTQQFDGFIGIWRVVVPFMTVLLARKEIDELSSFERGFYFFNL
jgi:phytoene dehydrogenase-like protein